MSEEVSSDLAAFDNCVNRIYLQTRRGRRGIVVFSVRCALYPVGDVTGADFRVDEDVRDKQVRDRIVQSLGCSACPYKDVTIPRTIRHIEADGIRETSAVFGLAETRPITQSSV